MHLLTALLNHVWFGRDWKVGRKLLREHKLARYGLVRTDKGIVFVWFIYLLQLNWTNGLWVASDHNQRGNVHRAISALKLLLICTGSTAHCVQAERQTGHEYLGSRNKLTIVTFTAPPRQIGNSRGQFQNWSIYSWNNGFRSLSAKRVDECIHWRVLDWLI